MISRMWFGRAVVFVLLLGVLTASAGAQLYVGPGVVVLDQGRALYPYSYAPAVPGSYLYGYANPFGPWYGFPSVPPPSRYLAPSFSYNANPYAQFPNSFSYEVPAYNYAPNSFTYDLRAYGYGYAPPPLYAYPVSPYYYTPYSYYVGRRPYYWRGPYHAMTLQQYNDRSLHGPTRVRDIVPGVPELGG